MIVVYRNEAVSLEELRVVSIEILKLLTKQIIILNGEMGAGKTTFMTHLCKAMGVEDAVSSPTFSIVNEYLLPNGNNLYHFDCYRLKDEYEAIDIGFEDYLYSGNYCFIEWASKIPTLIPDEFIEIEILMKDEYLREIVVREHDTREV